MVGHEGEIMQTSEEKEKQQRTQEEKIMTEADIKTFS